jgi:hypothetical protein
MRADFADAPADLDLSLTENAAWDTYCAGRLARMGVEVNQQRWRYNHRNRFGFNDRVDAEFDRLWSADDLGWSDITDRRLTGRPTTPRLRRVPGGAVHRECDANVGLALRRGGGGARSDVASRGRRPCPRAASGRHGCTPTTRTG